MTPDLPWQALLGPTARWLIRRLPAFLLSRYYNAEDLEGHLKMRLLAESGATLNFAKGLAAPSLEIQWELFNLSPYLDIEVAALHSFLSSAPEHGGDVFAAQDAWGGYQVRRGTSRLLQLTYWLNQFQSTVVSSCLDKHIPICASVSLDVSSRVGVVRPFKNFYISNPTLK